MTLTLAWAALLTAGVLGALMVVSLKQAAGFSDPAWTTVSLGAAGALVLLLGVALQALPAATVLPAWSGVASLVAVAGAALVLGERLDSERVFWIGLIVLGVLGLRFERLL